MAMGVDSFHLFINDVMPLLRKIEEILAIVGMLYVGKVALTTLCDITVGIRAHIYSKLWSRNFVQRYGKWAVVTGCTDGIGKAYAEELAKEGLNIVLISRNMDKLRRVATDLGNKYKIETEIIQVDFSEGRPIYKTISDQIKNKEIGMLVNNVGVMLDQPKCFGEATEDEIWSHVNVNMGSVCAMTRLILPEMAARGKGAVINIASIAGSGPIPLMGIYAASKSFVDFFSQSLEWEYRNKGITVQTVNPSYVATNMTSYSSWIGSESLLIPSASLFASHAVSTIGYTKRTNGYWLHGIQSWFVCKVMSTWSFMFAMATTHKFLAAEVKNKKAKSHDQ